MIGGLPQSLAKIDNHQKDLQFRFATESFNRSRAATLLVKKKVMKVMTMTFNIKCNKLLTSLLHYIVSKHKQFTIVQQKLREID